MPRIRDLGISVLDLADKKKPPQCENTKKPKPCDHTKLPICAPSNAPKCAPSNAPKCAPSNYKQTGEAALSDAAIAQLRQQLRQRLGTTLPN